MHHCKSFGCGQIIPLNEDFCSHCQNLQRQAQSQNKLTYEVVTTPKTSLSEKYPKYYKSVGNNTEIDVYAVHQLFNIQDPSGAIQHASKKLLLSGVRTGGKSAYDDIKEARDTLSRWLELNPQEKAK